MVKQEENIKIALVHDWYYVNGGAEKVIKAINEVFPDCEHFALFDIMPKEEKLKFLKTSKVTTTFAQKLPFISKFHRNYLQLYPCAIEQLDLSGFDIVISSSSSVAKGVLTNSNQVHICYCHSPMRYAWGLYHTYLKESRFNWITKSYAKYVLHKLRLWDVISSNRVDFFIANSNYISKRINKIYRRDSVVIYPPIDVNFFSLSENATRDYYFTASRMVSYKKIDLIVETFAKNGNKLIVAGDGPEFKKIKSKSKENIVFLGYISKEELKKYLQNAKAFVFAAEEDFGIVPVEAQACGTPVIAFGKGGALETVIDNKTGVLFYEQTTESLQKAIERFENYTFDYSAIRKHSLKFSTENFKDKIEQYVIECAKEAGW